MHVKGTAPWGQERPAAGSREVNNSQNLHGLGQVQVLRSQKETLSDTQGMHLRPQKGCCVGIVLLRLLWKLSTLRLPLLISLEGPGCFQRTSPADQNKRLTKGFKGRQQHQGTGSLPCVSVEFHKGKLNVWLNTSK